MTGTPPTPDAAPTAEPPAAEPAFRLVGPRRKFLVRLVIVLAVLVYTGAVALTKYLSPSGALPNAIIAVKWENGPADAKVLVEGINGTRLDPPLEGTFEKSEEYVCRLHVHKGWYRLTVTHGGAVYFLQEFPMDEFSQQNVALVPLPPARQPEPELSE